MKYLLGTFAAVTLALICAFPEHALMIISSGAMLGAAVQIAQGPLTDRVRPYDLVKWETNPLFTRTAGTIKNPSATTLAQGALQAGFPVKLVSTQWTIVLSTDEANTGGLFLGDDAYAIPEALAQNAITQYKYPILVRGPALVNQSRIATKDPANASYTVATIVTALAALQIQSMVEPATTMIQNT